MSHMISASVSDEEYDFVKKKHIRWSYVIGRGIDYMNDKPAINALQEEYRKLKEKQIKTAELLQKAINGEELM